MRFLSDAARASALRFYGRPDVRAVLTDALGDLGAIPYGTVVFAETIAAFQAGHGLIVDGKAGPRTRAALFAARVGPSTPGMPPDALVFRGQWIPVPGLPVVHAVDPAGYNLETAKPGTHVHGLFAAGRPTQLVLHDSLTVSARATFDVLRTRKDKAGRNAGLGVQVVLDPRGLVYQFVPDLALRCWHASGTADFALGVEVVGLLDPALAPTSPLRRPPTSWAPRGYLDYTDAQKRALPVLLRALCDGTGVPFDWLRRPDGGPATAGGDKTVQGAADFLGIVGHGQLSAARWDGNRALEVLAGLP